MGLKNREAVNYIKLKDGKFYASSDKENKTPYDELEGQITGISFRNDTFEGQEVEKLQLTINDGVEDYVIGMSFNSSYAASLISFLKTVDLSRPLSLVPTFRKEKDGKENRSILIRQNGKWATSYYTKAHPNGLPSFKKTKLNGKDVWDKTDYLDFLRYVVTTEIAPKLGQATVIGTQPATATATTAQAVHVNDVDEVADDLPF